MSEKERMGGGGREGGERPPSASHQGLPPSSPPSREELPGSQSRELTVLSPPPRPVAPSGPSGGDWGRFGAVDGTQESHKLLPDSWHGGISWLCDHEQLANLSEPECPYL